MNETATLVKGHALPAGVGDPQMRHLWEENQQLRQEVESLRALIQRQPPEELAGHPGFHAILREMADLHARKAQDYGRGKDPLANIRGSAEWGIAPWLGAMLRANDKIHRLKSFALTGHLANEGVEDSLQDLAAYAIIALVLFREARA